MLMNLNKWTSALDDGKNVDVIYFDFSKAFDRVPHSKLVQKLVMVGVHPRIIAWIAAFLEGRTFSVRINESFSDPRPVTSGVPQGGVLSPVLFNIYTHELPHLLSRNGVEFSAFADDIKIFRVIDSVNDSQSLQNSIDALHSWTVDWNLPLSKEKTKVLHLGGNNPNYPYYVDGSLITSVDEVTDLGFVVTKSLSFDKHCELIANKATAMVFKLFRALSTSNSAVLLWAYKTYVRPLLEYGTPVFSPFKRRVIEMLERVQNCFTRKLMIRALGFVYDKIPSSIERNQNLSLHKLSTRRKANDLLLLHKILFGKCDIKPEDLFFVRASSTRGGARKFQARVPKLNCRRFFLSIEPYQYLRNYPEMGSPRWVTMRSKDACLKVSVRDVVRCSP